MVYRSYHFLLQLPFPGLTFRTVMATHELPRRVESLIPWSDAMMPLYTTDLFSTHHVLSLLAAS